MSRPSNQDQLNKEPNLEAGTEAAVSAATAKYPQAKALEAKVTSDGGAEVKLGWQDENGQAHIVELKVDAAGNVGGGEERPDVPPGQAKKADHAHGKSVEAHEKSGESHGKKH